MTQRLSYLRLLLVASLATSIFFACKKDDDKDDPSKAIQCDTAGFTLNNTRHSVEIKNILDSNGCFGCHAASQAQGGVVLEGYDNIKKYVDDDRLLGAIAHLNGYEPMPQGGAPKMAQNEICRIKFWVDNGAPNN